MPYALCVRQYGAFIFMKGIWFLPDRWGACRTSGGNRCIEVRWACPEESTGTVV